VSISEALLPEFDEEMALHEACSYTPETLETVDAMLETFEGSVKRARELIAKVNDADFTALGTLKKGGEAMFTAPRAGTSRDLSAAGPGANRAAGLQGRAGF
jgi:hypothetical protein